MSANVNEVSVLCEGDASAFVQVVVARPAELIKGVTSIGAVALDQALLLHMLQVVLHNRGIICAMRLTHNFMHQAALVQHVVTPAIEQMKNMEYQRFVVCHVVFMTIHSFAILARRMRVGKPQMKANEPPPHNEKCVSEGA